MAIVAIAGALLGSIISWIGWLVMFSLILSFIMIFLTLIVEDKDKENAFNSEPVVSDIQVFGIALFVIEKKGFKTSIKLFHKID